MQKYSHIYLKTTNDFKSGWALTKDSFCYSGDFGDSIIKYRDISKVIVGKLRYSDEEKNALIITLKNGEVLNIGNWELGSNREFMENIKDYLYVVKDF